ncbi:accessory Sec system protein Asp2 [Lactococcus lactis]|uniref:accessory Sec system protein Asp2 n=1 Tax=Lactococcus lactis TaxID=1358 RepID=UPI00288FC4F7|nr:accessory Sec system protein Asp2 [Lactococcus lactis]MDT2887981.1 accessory Sec system protein Asp2 [Lactococcus lactis]MDT2930761.1 accessory Sec system protein Asp2 [Lactococcus lactis]
MNKKIKALQIGMDNWEKGFSQDQKDTLEWLYFNSYDSGESDISILLEKMNDQTFDVVLITGKVNWGAVEKISKFIEPYRLIIDECHKTNIPLEFKLKKCPWFVDALDKKEVIETIIKYFFPGQMGSKLHINTILVNEKFIGEKVIFGQSHIKLSGNFSSCSEGTLLTWQQNIGMYGRSKKIWLEFACEDGVEISLIILKMREGTTQVIERCTYTQDKLKNGIEIEYDKKVGYVSLSLIVEGSGAVDIGPLHFRDSRASYGEYIPGGKKIYDKSNQELFYYFYPGDLKPPLNIYFSGYRSAEGFEGFFMMKKLGSPFLLITDPRLEGGSFYMGSLDLEKKIVRIISNYLIKLGFTNTQLVLSGLSMGTYGALYYASKLSPRYVIVGKPLVNIGDIAANETIVRPGGFPTSLDILYSLTGKLSDEGVSILNSRFWTSFEKSNFSNTIFIISYMKNDDYDLNAYKDIITSLSSKNSIVIGKGIPGRHNDNSQAINEWFISQYRRILVEEYGRKRRNDGF